VVLVKNPEAFAARYGAGVPTLGTYSGKLSNAGEQITLRDAAGATIHVFTYQDWWELATDGGGYSLTVRDEGVPVDQWSNAAQWKASGRTHGTPGGPDEDPGGDYTAWASEEFTPEELADPEISGPLAAPSGYVVSNLLRYAFGAASPQDLAGALPEVISQNGERRIRFRRRIGAADLVFGIEVSNNLSEWDRLETTLEVEQSAGGGLEWVTASFQEGDARSRYVRIQVVLRGTVE
jgi:hypothetical protein